MPVSIRSALSIIGLTGALAAAVSPAVASAPAAFSSSETVVTYAIETGCLTYLREGGHVLDYVAGSARTITEDGKTGIKIYGNGHVTVHEDERGGCSVKAAHGNGARLRDAVINTLADAGLRTEPFADYEPILKGRDWASLQEMHCFRMYDIVYIALISSSANGTRTPLQVSMFRDRDGIAAKKGLCQG